MIIDAHLHLPVKKKSLVDSKRRLLSSMKRNKIDYAIVIPDNEKNSSIGDMDQVLKLCKDKNLFVMGTLDILNDKKTIFTKLEKLMKDKKIVAVKIFSGHDNHHPNDKRLTPLFKSLIKYDLPLVVHTGTNTLKDLSPMQWNDPKYIVKIAKKYPKLKIVIAHYYWPKVDYCYDITRRFKNIYFDTSALAHPEVLIGVGLAKMKRILVKTLKDNPKSVLFGTDYACCGVKPHLDLINSLRISKDLKEMVFWKNAVELFKLNI
jgi:uncharacterized protein